MEKIGTVRVTWPSAPSDILITGRMRDGVLVVSLGTVERAHRDVGAAHTGDQVQWMRVTEWGEGIDQVVVTERVRDRQTIVFSVGR